jgi:acyl-CoA synthetase (AMP-forming)/AMP-acid ligase II/acyl carrier protein
MDVSDAGPPACCSNLFEVLRWRSEHQPDRRAFTFLRDGEDDEVHITYEALDRRTRAIAALLQRETRPGDRALLLYPSGLEYIAAFLGCLYAAVIAVPVYPPNPRRERTLSRLVGIVRDARPSVVLTTSAILPIASSLAAGYPEFADIAWMATDVADDADAAAWCQPGISPDALAFLQYTSGSTTTPRGVMVTHRNLMHNEALMRRAGALSEDSIGVSWLPLYHDMGLIGAVLQPIYSGFPCTLMSPVDFIQKPFRWLQAIHRYRATASAAPNFAYDLCIRRVTPEQRAGLDLSSWTVAINGAEPVRPETFDGFMAAFGPCGLRRDALHPSYGLAEATLLVSSGPASSEPVTVRADRDALRHGTVTVVSSPATQPVSTLLGCGSVAPEQQVVIVDPGTRLRCSPGQVGEIWVAGPSVTAGYWGSPAATEETFHARLADSCDGPFLRTGDQGFVYDGQLFVTSRLKDLVIIRGRNHAPQDIESSAGASHPALRPGCGAAFSIELDGSEQLVIVHEVDRRHLSVDCEEVAAAIRRAVAEDHEVDVYAVVLVKPGAVPKTSSGKLQRRACRDEFLGGTLSAVGQSVREMDGRAGTEDEPDGGMLAALLDAEPGQRKALLLTYLRRRIAGSAGISPWRVRADQPLLELGLDSLKLLELRQRLEAELGVTMPLERFADTPTIAELAVPVLDEFERNVGAAWGQVAALDDEQIDARLAQLSAKETGHGDAR